MPSDRQSLQINVNLNYMMGKHIGSLVGMKNVQVNFFPFLVIDSSSPDTSAYLFMKFTLFINYHFLEEAK